MKIYFLLALAALFFYSCNDTEFDGISNIRKNQNNKDTDATDVEKSDGNKTEKAEQATEISGSWLTCAPTNDEGIEYGCAVMKKIAGEEKKVTATFSKWDISLKAPGKDAYLVTDYRTGEKDSPWHVLFDLPSEFIGIKFSLNVSAGNLGGEVKGNIIVGGGEFDLQNFSISPGENHGELVFNGRLPDKFADITKIEFRRLKGQTLPNENCIDGELITPLQIPLSEQDFSFVDKPTDDNPPDFYSYRVCIIGNSDEKTTIATEPTKPTDLLPPPELSGFSANPGTEDGQIILTVNFPKDVSDYARVEICEVAGDNAPAEDCSDGAILLTVDDMTSKTFNRDTGDAGAHFSYRARLYDDEENVSTMVKAGIIAYESPSVKSIKLINPEWGKSCMDVCQANSMTAIGQGTDENGENYNIYNCSSCHMTEISADTSAQWVNDTTGVICNPVSSLYLFPVSPGGYCPATPIGKCRCTTSSPVPFSRYGDY